MKNLFGQEPFELRGAADAQLARLDTDLEDLDTRVTLNEFAIDNMGMWVGYTPALTAATTNPTLGTGSIQQGRYTRTGRTIHGWAYIGFGTAGTAAGSGEYRISIPATAYPPPVGNVVVGSGYLYNASGNVIEQVVVSNSSGQAGYFIMFKNGTFTIHAGAPWGWTANDHISIRFSYEAAS